MDDLGIPYNVSLFPSWVQVLYSLGDNTDLNKFFSKCLTVLQGELQGDLENLKKRKKIQ